MSHLAYVIRIYCKSATQIEVSDTRKIQYVQKRNNIVMNFSIIIDIPAAALTSADRRFLNFLRSRPNFPVKNFTQPRFYIRKKVHQYKYANLTLHYYLHYNEVNRYFRYCNRQ